MLKTVPHPQTGKPAVSYPVARKLTGWGPAKFKKRVDSRYGSAVPLGVLQDIVHSYEGMLGVVLFYKRACNLEAGLVK